MAIEPTEHSATGSEIHHAFAHICSSLVVLTQPAVAIEPAEGAFDDPTLGQDLKTALLLGPTYDIQHEGKELMHPFHQHHGIALIGPYPFEAWQAAIAGIEQLYRAFTISHTCARHNHHDQQAQRIYQDMPFAAFDLFASIIAASLTLLSGLHTLAINHRCTWSRIAPQAGANLHPQSGVDSFNRTISQPLIKVVGDVLPVRQIMRQHAPLATSTVQVHDRIHNVAQIDGSFATWPGRLLEHCFNLCPFVVAQITIVRLPRQLSCWYPALHGRSSMLMLLHLALAVPARWRPQFLN